MKNKEILGLLNKLEMFKYENVYTYKQMEKDKITLTRLKQKLTLTDVGCSKTDKKEPKYKYENNYFILSYDSKTELIITLIALAFFIIGIVLVVNSFK